MSSTSLRRALLLGIAGIGVAACDLAEFVADPKPIFEQTWNLPAPDMSVSIASLLPPDVTILPDSSAFDVTMSGANIGERVGDHCAACEALNGTNAPKPAFNLFGTSSAALPTDVISAVITGGQVDIALTNNLSFDPLFANTNPGATEQGVLVVTIRSASLVLGVDTVRGETTPWPPGTVLNRSIPFTTGTVTGSLTVDVSLDSPLGDHNEFINANGTVNASATVPSLEVASVTIDVTGTALDDAQADTLDLTSLEETITDHVVGGELRMTVTNPIAVGGSVNAVFEYAPGLTITKSFTLPSASTGESIVSLDSADMAQLFGNEVALQIGGNVTATGPVTVTPTQAISMTNRLVLRIRTGS